ncbi:pyruvate formate lyase-activating protein [Anaerococcus sp. AGMB00486]|uniref:Pyruvate formate-lyase-activating enzyme n=1 Tax=Anaerococcus faecalis TaxID=2742993 RepID=A0ABX2NBT7_9FIRM|nr:pyruvate formate-lyase-activating protein [Anaerococcus faecalis]NVF12014.1 pyruvate formate lyase-activating protein [Anaerococcus faecalis]
MLRLHSIETMGLVDGPGIRTIFFLQGCPLHCIYCHNPDTQNTLKGKEVSVDYLVEKAKRMKPYFKNGGGVTISGGEPLIHGKDLIKLIDSLHKENIHVCLDTSGIGNSNYYEEIIDKVDLILLDIKHYNILGFKEMVGFSNDKLLKFIDYIKNSFTPIWIRHVMVPGFTDSKEDMENLVKFIHPISKNIEKIEILPYHTLGIKKYEEIGKDYKLKGVEAMDKKKAKSLESYANSLLELYRKESVKEKTQK